MTSLRVGIVGAGHISAAHAAGWRRSPGCRLEAISDLDCEAAQRLAGRFSIPRLAPSLDSLLTDCDVIDICTPPHTHARLIDPVLTAGRDLLVEKPIVTDVGDWDRLRQRLETGDTRLGVVHNLKFSGAIQRALTWVREGRIGDLLRIDHLFLTHPERDRMLVSEGHWSHALPGGRWFETLPHALYLVHALAGALEVAGVVALTSPRAPSGVRADEVTVTLRGTNLLATIHYSASSRANRRMLVVEGTSGQIEIDILGDAAFLHRRTDAKWKRPWTRSLGRAGSIVRQWPLDRGRYLAARARSITPHSRLIRSFATYLHGDGPHPTPLAEVDYVVRLCDRIGRAIDAETK